ncbi:MAG: glycosyltransferase family 2 protein [Deinococcota bacterium]
MDTLVMGIDTIATASASALSIPADTTSPPLSSDTSPSDTSPSDTPSPSEQDVSESIPGPKVSVFMATYNYGRFIEQAIDSVLAQTFAEFELIIGDNASTDDTAALVQPYLSDPRVSYFCNDENLGVCENFNRCYRAMHPDSRYFIGLPADDYWDETLLASLFDIAERHPEVTFVHCDGYRFEDNPEGNPATPDVYGTFTELFGDILPPQGRHRTLRELYHRNYIPFQGAFVNKTQFLAYYPYDDPYYDALPLTTDYHLWSQILTRGGLAYFHPEPLVYVRKHGQALTSEKNIIARLKEEYKLLSGLREVASPQMMETLERNIYERGKRLLFKLLEVAELEQASTLLAELMTLASRPSADRLGADKLGADVQAARAILALPLSKRLQARLWRLLSQGWQALNRSY